MCTCNNNNKTKRNGQREHTLNKLYQAHKFSCEFNKLDTHNIRHTKMKREKMAHLNGFDMRFVSNTEKMTDYLSNSINFSVFFLFFFPLLVLR